MRVIQSMLLVGLLFLAACSSQPVPKPLVGDWLCNNPAGTFSVLSDIKYDEKGDFVAHIQGLIVSSRFSVDGDRISYSHVKDPKVLQHLPISYQATQDPNTIKFGFADPVSSAPNMATCSRKN